MLEKTIFCVIHSPWVLNLVPSNIYKYIRNALSSKNFKKFLVGEIMFSFSVQSAKKEEFIDITAKVRSVVDSAGIKNGLVCVFVPHTTCGLTINENADPDVATDILMALRKAIPDSLAFAHLEGNSTAHIKASLMGSSVNLIVEKGQLQLGTWQGVFLCEFDGPRTRKVWVQMIETD